MMGKCAILLQAFVGCVFHASPAVQINGQSSPSLTPLTASNINRGPSCQQY
jgi:hypothetical protein